MKKTITIYIAFILFFCGLTAAKGQVLWNIRKDSTITYYYEDGDEFNDSTHFKNKWGSWFGWARNIASNKEQQYYTDYLNHDIKDGTLNLTVRKKAIHARLTDWKNDNDTIRDGAKFIGFNKRNFNYSAGLITSKKEYLFGYFEIKLKAPDESGLWPAFWLYGGTPNEEIDLMELNGVHQNQIHVDTHCPNHCDYVKYLGQSRSFGGWIKLSGRLNEGYNVVSGSWDEHEIRFYFNGALIARSKVSFGIPKFLVANVAVPSNDGPFHPAPDPAIENFTPMSIDYIRVWSKEKNKSSEKIIDESSVNKYLSNHVHLKKSPKRLYGKKKAASNEGIFVSAFKTDNNSLSLFCNGLSKDDSISVKLLDSDNKIIFDKISKDLETTIPVKILSGYTIEIAWNGRRALHTF